MRFKEPKAINDLVREANQRDQETLNELGEKIPKFIEPIFKDYNVFSEYFENMILSEWLYEKKYEELVDYCIYQFQDAWNDRILKDLIFSLRQEKNEELGNKLFDALYVNRASYFWIQLKNYKKYPDNLHCATSFNVAKGEVLKVLGEQLFLLENKAGSLKDEVKILEVKKKIEEILSEKKQKN